MRGLKSVVAFGLHLLVFAQNVPQVHRGSEVNGDGRIDVIPVVRISALQSEEPYSLELVCI